MGTSLHKYWAHILIFLILYLLLPLSVHNPRKHSKVIDENMKMTFLLFILSPSQSDNSFVISYPRISFFLFSISTEAKIPSSYCK